MKFMMKVLLGVVVVLVSVVVVQVQIMLKWVYVYEMLELFYIEFVWVVDEIVKCIDGCYKIDVYFVLQLGKEVDINQGLKLGMVDIIILGFSFVLWEYKLIGVIYYFYIFCDLLYLIVYMKSDVFKKLVVGYEEVLGNYIIVVIYYGMCYIMVNKDIKICVDMQGLKMCVLDVFVYLVMLCVCGVNIIFIVFVEVYLVLQNGMVEVQENLLIVIEVKKFYEVQKNIVLIGYIVDYLNIVMLKIIWVSFLDEDKVIFFEVMFEVVECVIKIVEECEVVLVDKFKVDGLIVIEVDKEDFLKNVFEKLLLE